MSKIDSKPDWIRTSEIGSFAESTIKQRKPEILRRILAENDLSSSAIQKIHDFQSEIIGDSPPQPLTETTVDTVFWNKKLAAWNAVSWLDLPWYFAEAYFYRKVLQATGYYQSSQAGFLRDPFHAQKANQLKVDLISLENASWLFNPEDEERSLDRLILAALWGNRADLSHMDIDLSSPALDLGGGDHLEMLLNDLPAIKQYFSKKNHSIAYLTDNVGRELYSDLALIEYLLSSNTAEYITMMVKPAPLFVSDVTRKDVDLALQYLQESDSQVHRAFVDRFQSLVSEGRLVVLEEPSLCGYQMFDEMAVDFNRYLSRFDLTIVKGDANYRRIVGDRHWNFSQSIREIVDYFPTDLLLLRTLKSEIIVNLSPEKVESLNRKYENWLVKGFCGVVQLVEKDKEAFE